MAMFSGLAEDILIVAALGLVSWEMGLWVFMLSTLALTAIVRIRRDIARFIPCRVVTLRMGYWGVGIRLQQHLRSRDDSRLFDLILDVSCLCVVLCILECSNWIIELWSYIVIGSTCNARLTTVHGRVHSIINISGLIIHVASTTRWDMANYPLKFTRRECREFLWEGYSARLWRPEDCLGLSILFNRVPWAQLLVYNAIKRASWCCLLLP